MLSSIAKVFVLTLIGTTVNGAGLGNKNKMDPRKLEINLLVEDKGSILQTPRELIQQAQAHMLSELLLDNLENFAAQTNENAELHAPTKLN